MERDDPVRLAAVDHMGRCSDCAGEYRAAADIATRMERAAGRRDAVRGGGTGGGRGRGWSAPGRMLALAALLVVATGLAIGLTFERRALGARLARLASELLAREADLAVARREAAEAAARDAQVISDLRTSVETLSRPQANVPIIDLVPEGILRGPGAPSSRLDYPPGAASVTLVLTVTGARRHATYALRLEEAGAGLVARVEGLERGPHDTFTIALPRAAAPPGDYTLRLLGSRQGREETVATYRARIRHLD